MKGEGEVVLPPTMSERLLCNSGYSGEAGGAPTLDFRKEGKRKRRKKRQ